MLAQDIHHAWSLAVEYTVAEYTVQYYCVQCTVGLYSAIGLLYNLC